MAVLPGAEGVQSAARATPRRQREVFQDTTWPPARRNAGGSMPRRLPANLVTSTRDGIVSYASQRTRQRPACRSRATRAERTCCARYEHPEELRSVLASNGQNCAQRFRALRQLCARPEGHRRWSAASRRAQEGRARRETGRSPASQAERLPARPRLALVTPARRAASASALRARPRRPRGCRLGCWWQRRRRAAARRWREEARPRPGRGGSPPIWPNPDRARAASTRRSVRRGLVGRPCSVNNAAGVGATGAFHEEAARLKAARHAGPERARADGG
jgi:hypothetical protein